MVSGDQGLLGNPGTGSRLPPLCFVFTQITGVCRNRSSWKNLGVVGSGLPPPCFPHI